MIRNKYKYSLYKLQCILKILNPIFLFVLKGFVVRSGSSSGLGGNHMCGTRGLGGGGGCRPFHPTFSLDRYGRISATANRSSSTIVVMNERTRK